MNHLKKAAPLCAIAIDSSGNIKDLGVAMAQCAIRPDSDRNSKGLTLRHWVAPLPIPLRGMEERYRTQARTAPSLGATGRARRDLRAAIVTRREAA